MSDSATAEWDDNLLDDEDVFDLGPLDTAKSGRQQQLDIRRKLEDRMELKRLREQISDLDTSWLD
ncbi:MAG: hypothetical protein SV765_16870 [Pseudomonadota bacterium]|nr:hypothetical protein [Pseudomonadales bacterium]MDY6921874.1 hypothetical protein [Pseudomonadota bacterium]